MVADHVGDGLASLVSFAGITVPSRARFIGQSLASTALPSVTLGLVCGQVGAVCPAVGPLVPYLVGSWIGFSWGCIGFWRRIKSQALNYAARYPKILAHSLSVTHNVEIPREVMLMKDDGTDRREGVDGTTGKNGRLERWISTGGLGRLSFAILAAQDCREDVEEMQKEERQRIMEEEREK